MSLETESSSSSPNSSKLLNEITNMVKTMQTSQKNKITKTQSKKTILKRTVSKTKYDLLEMEHKMLIDKMQSEQNKLLNTIKLQQNKIDELQQSLNEAYNQVNKHQNLKRDKTIIQPKFTENFISEIKSMASIEFEEEINGRQQSIDDTVQFAHFDDN